MVLRGVFLGRQCDLDWLYAGGAARLQPQAWEAFLSPLSTEERKSPLESYHRRLHGSGGGVNAELASAWAKWEASCATLLPNASVQQGFAAGSTSLASIETHYFVNQCFMAPDQLLKGMKPIQRVPGIVVHGRYDLVCPVEQAHALCQRWPAAQLRIVRDAGHSVRETGIAQALLKAVAEMAAHGRKDT